MRRPDRRALRHQPSRADRLARRFRADRHAGPAFRRALRRCFRAADLPGVRAGAREGDGRAVGRRRGRGVRRLSPPPLLRGGEPGARAAAAQMRARGVRHARPRLSQGRLGAAPAARQDNLRGARPLARGGLCARRRRDHAGDARALFTAEATRAARAAIAPRSAIDQAMRDAPAADCARPRAICRSHRSGCPATS